MSAALVLGDGVGKAVACRALDVPHAKLYRRMLPAFPDRVPPRRGPWAKLNSRLWLTICTRSVFGTRFNRRLLPSCLTRICGTAADAWCQIQVHNVAHLLDEACRILCRVAATAF